MFPAELVDRLPFDAQASVFVLVWVLIGVLLVSTARRLSPQDIGGSATGTASEPVAINAAFLQNTLEQAVLAVGFYVALATLVTARWLSGVRGRSLGMTLTMMPTFLGNLLFWC